MLSENIEFTELMQKFVEKSKNIQNYFKFNLNPIWRIHPLTLINRIPLYISS